MNINNFTVEITHPVVNVYEFVGSLTVEEEEKVGVGIEQTLWRGVKVASGKGLAMIIYTGTETKLSLNCKEPGSKFG